MWRPTSYLDPPYPQDVETQVNLYSKWCIPSKQTQGKWILMKESTDTLLQSECIISVYNLTCMEKCILVPYCRLCYGIIGTINGKGCCQSILSEIWPNAIDTAPIRSRYLYCGSNILIVLLPQSQSMIGLQTLSYLLLPKYCNDRKQVIFTYILAPLIATVLCQ